MNLNSKHAYDVNDIICTVTFCRQNICFILPTLQLQIASGNVEAFF